MTDTLQRITTEYIEAEDRIRLAGEAGEKTMVLWLTQRFLNRLIVLVKKSHKPHFASFV